MKQHSPLIIIIAVTTPMYELNSNVISAPELWIDSDGPTCGSSRYQDLTPLDYWLWLG